MQICLLKPVLIGRPYAQTRAVTLARPSAQAVVDITDLGLKWQKLIFSQCWGPEVQGQGSAGLVSEESLPGLWTATSSPCACACRECSGVPSL